MHIQQVRISHVPDESGCHSLWRSFDIFLPEFINKFLIHAEQPPICDKYSMKQKGKEVKQCGKGEGSYVWSLSFRIILPERHVCV